MDSGTNLFNSNPAFPRFEHKIRFFAYNVSGNASLCSERFMERQQLSCIGPSIYR